ncbi:MAG: hypothetical protein MRY60_08950 [Algiphilus sp.]|uniref:hypothetical protein n=1 Tax=Algiphilus sp. TaxID=1872431 RepID=UPI0025C72367|nr:hypothetical protein [Algiphilus sp.]MCI5103891.1 hypothetical protein [Algiphilus sp.]
MTRQPLFRDSGEGDQREDAYSGPFGFLIGGITGFERHELAEQYLTAANLLVESIRKQQVADYEIAYPVLFLYRHALEVLIKFLIGSESNHHRLDALADDLVRFARDKHGERVPSWIVGRLREIARIDPTSEAFRYGEDRYEPKARRPVPHETYVRVAELNGVINELYAALKRAADVAHKRSSNIGQ